jgi:hypothetical protein
VGLTPFYSATSAISKIFTCEQSFALMPTATLASHFRLPTPTSSRGTQWGYSFVGPEAEIGIHKPAGYRTGALTVKDPLPRVLAPAAQPAHAADEWATLEIIAQQERIQTLVNGKLVNDVIDKERKFSRGHIALASWEDGKIKTEAQFRKVEIKRLLK